MYVRMYTKCATTRYVCKHFGNLVSSSRPCCYPQYTKKCLPAKVSECIRVVSTVCACVSGELSNAVIVVAAADDDDIHFGIVTML